MLQHLAGGRVDLMIGRGNMGPGLPLVRAGHPQRHPARGRELRPAPPPVARGRRGLGGPVPDAADRASPRRPGRSTASRRSCGTARSAAPRSPSRPPTTATASSTTTSSGPRSTSSGWSTLYRRRFEHYGHGPADQAIVGLGGQIFMRADSQAAIREFRPYFDNAPVYGGGPSLEDYMDQTPLTVGSPQQVIDRTLAFREYRRRLPAPAVPRRPRRPAARGRCSSRWTCSGELVSRSCAASSRSCAEPRPGRADPRARAAAAACGARALPRSSRWSRPHDRAAA